MLCRLYRMKLGQAESNRTLALLNERMMYVMPLDEFRKTDTHSVVRSVTAILIYHNLCKLFSSLRF